MPRPIGRGQRYVPGLDGVRALAVGAVVVYHLRASWLPGGLLGVGVFFTLSGYLITDLLLGGWERTGRLSLGEFWLRRARRLLPALIVLLVVVVSWVAVGDASQLGAMRGEAISGLFYVNNWWQIAHHVSYFARFGQPSPLGNLWSLAVEEQFYLVWPWVVLGAVVLARRRSQRHVTARRRARLRRLLAAGILVLAAASAVEMAVLFHPALDPTRVCDGTDTRAFGLLVGASLAAILPNREGARHATARTAAILDIAGVGGLTTVALLMWRTSQYSPFLYRGGMVLLSVATAVVIASVMHSSSHVGRLLGCAPLRGIGIVSYGIYLWHYPVIVLTTPPARPVGVVRPLEQAAATLVLAVGSWFLIESPVRRGALARLLGRLRGAGSRLTARRSVVAATSGGTAIVAVAALAFAGVLPSAPAGMLAANAPAHLRVRHMLPSSRVIVLRSVPGPDGGGARSGGGSAGVRTVHRVRTRGGRRTTAPTRTSCTAVVHIGDSTSESLVSSTYLPASEQLPAQYARVGVARVVLEISGARSLVETLPGQMNGTEVARQLVAQGYRGCWVIALGTNDAANIAVGSPVSAADRVDTLMGLLQGQPVLWVSAVSELGAGAYADTSMHAWDTALVDACRRFPNMRVYDWAADVQPGWFISDGIHYGSTGSAARASGIANALATAFPQGSPASTHTRRSCVVP